MPKAVPLQKTFELIFVGTIKAAAQDRRDFFVSGDKR